MAGVPDREMEAKVEKLLMRKDRQDASDREIAKEAGCGKTFVLVVRARLIYRGLLKPRPDRPHVNTGVYSDKPRKVRGGYLMDPATGKVVREMKYRDGLVARPRKDKA